MKNEPLVSWRSDLTLRAHGNLRLYNSQQLVQLTQTHLDGAAFLKQPLPSWMQFCSDAAGSRTCGGMPRRSHRLSSSSQGCRHLGIQRWLPSEVLSHHGVDGL